jgi:acetyltransferase-like isoleucine patch superfamily enzyme
MKKLKQIWHLRSVIISLPHSIYFNLRYLPFKQAYKLPIILCKPKLLNLKGTVILDSSNVYTGIIRLGFPLVSVYPNKGIMWENQGGTVIFKGKCNIGNNSFISIGKKAEVTFGEDFLASSSLKLISTVAIEFGLKTRIGWNSLIMDTNFHPLFDLKTNTFKKASGPIKIGDYNWFGLECKVTHSVNTPERCVFGLNSIISRGSTFQSYSIHAGNPLRIVSTDVKRDYDNDTLI